jgi:hypothetical protein
MNPSDFLMLGSATAAGMTFVGAMWCALKVASGEERLFLRTMLLTALTIALSMEAAIASQLTPRLIAP